MYKKKMMGGIMKTVKFIKNNKDAIIPDYAHPGDAGMDLYSCEDVTIEPMDDIDLDNNDNNQNEE